MKNNTLNILMPILFAIITLLMIVYNVRDNQIKVLEYSNDNISLKYDSTWRVNNEDYFSIEHKKSDSTFKILVKELDSNYYDTSLKDLIKDVIYDIEKQNEGFNLINIEDNITDKYDGYSYLYENQEEQVLVNVYKKDNKLVIAYYCASNEYYDIVLDSVDTILNSLEIKSGI